MFWLAAETRDSKCYSPPSICARKLQSLTGINELKTIIFTLYYLTVIVYTKTTINLSVGGQRWILTEPRLEPPLRLILVKYKEHSLERKKQIKKKEKKEKESANCCQVKPTQTLTPRKILLLGSIDQPKYLKCSHSNTRISWYTDPFFNEFRKNSYHKIYRSVVWSSAFVNL